MPCLSTPRPCTDLEERDVRAGRTHTTALHPTALAELGWALSAARTSAHQCALPPKLARVALSSEHSTVREGAPLEVLREWDMTAEQLQLAPPAVTRGGSEHVHRLCKGCRTPWSFPGWASAQARSVGGALRPGHVRPASLRLCGFATLGQGAGASSAGMGGVNWQRRRLQESRTLQSFDPCDLLRRRTRTRPSMTGSCTLPRHGKTVPLKAGGAYRAWPAGPGWAGAQPGSLRLAGKLQGGAAAPQVA